MQAYSNCICDNIIIFITTTVFVLKTDKLKMYKNIWGPYINYFYIKSVEVKQISQNVG